MHQQAASRISLATYFTSAFSLVNTRTNTSTSCTLCSDPVYPFCGIRRSLTYVCTNGSSNAYTTCTGVVSGVVLSLRHGLGLESHARNVRPGIIRTTPWTNHDSIHRSILTRVIAYINIQFLRPLVNESQRGTSRTVPYTRHFRTVTLPALLTRSFPGHAEARYSSLYVILYVI